MAAVLVFEEMFKNCEDCPLFRSVRDFNTTIYYCKPYPGKELFMVDKKGISKNCPLRQLPQRMDENTYYHRAKFICDWKERAEGWNDCLKEITGETR